MKGSIKDIVYSGKRAHYTVAYAFTTFDVDQTSTLFLENKRRPVKAGKDRECEFGLVRFAGLSLLDLKAEIQNNKKFQNQLLHF